MHVLFNDDMMIYFILFLKEQKLAYSFLLVLYSSRTIILEVNITFKACLARRNGQYIASHFSFPFFSFLIPSYCLVHLTTVTVVLVSGNKFCSSILYLRLKYGTYTCSIHVRPNDQSQNNDLGEKTVCQ